MVPKKLFENHAKFLFFKRQFCTESVSRSFCNRASHTRTHFAHTKMFREDTSYLLSGLSDIQEDFYGIESNAVVPTCKFFVSRNYPPSSGFGLTSHSSSRSWSWYANIVQYMHRHRQSQFDQNHKNNNNLMLFLKTSTALNS